MWVFRITRGSDYNSGQQHIKKGRFAIRCICPFLWGGISIKEECIDWLQSFLFVIFSVWINNNNNKKNSSIKKRSLSEGRGDYIIRK